MFPLTDNQRAIWFDQRLFPSTALYNVSIYAKIHGYMDAATLEKALNILVAQNDAFRALFYETGAVPRQTFRSSEAMESCAIDYHDFSKEQDAEQACQSWMSYTAAIPLPHLENRLYTFALLKKSDREYFWYLKVHHTIADAWSLSLAVKKAAFIYEGLMLGRHDFSAVFSSYTDYIRDDVAYRNSGLYQADERYWKARFAEVPRAARIGIKEGNKNAGTESIRKTIYLDRALYTSLQQFARQQGATTFHAFLALLYVYFSRINQNPDLVIGVPILNRATDKFKNTCGLFTGILPVRMYAPGTSTFADLVALVKACFLEDMHHQRFPVDEVFRIVRSKDPDLDSLYDITLSFEKQDLNLLFNGFTTETVALPHQAERTPLAVFVRENASGKDVKIDFDFNLSCWDENYIMQFLEQFQGLMETLLHHPRQQINKVQLVTEQTKMALLAPGPPAVLPAETLVSEFEKTARLYGANTALEFEGRRLSYAALNDRSNALAHYLRNTFKIQPEEVIAFLIPKSDVAVIAILGILKSGAAYLPIDPGYPEERKRYMLEQSGARLLLAVEGSELPVFAGGVIWMDKEEYLGESTVNPSPVNTPEHTCYIIYTSGSTGRPKGVVVKHSGVVNVIAQYLSALRIAPSENCLQFASLSFDASVMEIFMTLFSGAALFPVSKDIIADFDRFKSFIREKDIAALILPPSYLRNLDKSALSGVRILLTAGEPAIPRSELNLREDQEYYNAYGPTECSICATIYKETDNKHTVPIGRPIGNIQVFILDQNLQLLPYGVPGELFIAGVGLAKGYKDNPVLTAEKFIAVPFAPGQLLYRTGDIGRWLSDGNIEYLGRIDDQVKIRGHRIEPGEIEATLSLHPAVKNVAVVVQERAEGEKGLYAFVVAPGLETTEVLYTFLDKSLPFFMIPDRLFIVENIPLTINGKVDKKQLLGNVTAEQVKTYVAPETESEKLVAAIWEDLLDINPIGTKDNFFRLGGHSLKAGQFINKVHKAIGVSLAFSDVFHTAVLKNLAALIDKKKEQASQVDGNIPVKAVPVHAFYPMSSPQKRSYLLHQAGGQELSYNMPEAFWVKGKLDIEMLERCFTALIQRHEILRTSFEMQDGAPVQVIRESVSFKIACTEAHTSDAYELVRTFIRPFDLSDPPLLRAHVYQLPTGEQLFLFDQHHIISDGVSRAIFMTELAQLCKGASLQPLAFQYKDFSVWQDRFLAAPVIKEQEDYWLQQFAEEVPELNLQTDFPRPVRDSFEGKKKVYQLPEALYHELEKAGKDMGYTTYQLLLGSFLVLLYKYSGNEDITVGTPAAGRSRPEWDNLLGMFVNTLALRAFPDGHKTLRAFLETVKHVSIDALKHQDYPFELLIDRLDIKRTAGTNPLFGIMFSFLQPEATQLSLGGALLEPLTDLPVTCKFDLLLEAVKQDKTIALNLSYRTELYRDTTMATFLDHYIRLLENLTSNLDKNLATINLLTPEEEELLLARNKDNGIVGYPADRCLHELFEEQVRKFPERTALVWEQEELTYTELNRRAGQVAATIRSVLPDAPNPIIAVLLDRSPEMIIALLGILKAGGAYLPIDPDYPADRIRYMLDDSGAGLLITRSDMNSVAGYTGQTIAIDQLHTALTYAALAVASSDLAYIIYTSGSTGKPKGVMIEHRNVVQLFFHDRPLFDFTENDTWTLFHSYCFDFSVWEMYGALLFGGKLVLVPKATAQSAGDFLALLEEQKVTVLNQTPGSFYNIIAAAADSVSAVNTLRYVIFGGEALKPAKLRQWRERYPSCKLINMYGITETTVHVTYKEITEQEINLNASNIGKPLPTLSLLILDQDGRLVPGGVAGELYVSGAGLARGYLNRLELSAERFVVHPYIAGEKLYRTGDLARMTESGDFEYLGRKDHQVKIRGFRIELGEIESKLLLHPEVKDVLVMDLEDPAGGEKYLCAYIAATGKPSITALRKHLSAFLPDYMIPAYFLILDHFPLTANGKTDRKRLPDPIAYADNQVMVGDLPGTETEKALLVIWQDVLKRERIGIHDNFFELGGHSLKATNAVARVFRSFQVNLPLQVFFKSPSIKEQAAYIDRQQKQIAEQIQPTAVRPFYPLSSSQKRLYLLHQMDAAAMSYNMPEAFWVKGKLDIKRLEQCLTTLIDRHEILRTAFEMCDGVPVQRIVKNCAFDIGYTKSPAAAVRELIHDFIRPFDLSVPPLLRAHLYDMSETEQLFLLDMHHIISDGVSAVLFAEELNRLYQGDSLEPLPIQYKDFAVWQNGFLASTAMQEQEQYWLQQFAEEVPVLNLQTDYPRPAFKSFKGKRKYYRLPDSLSAGLEQLCSRLGYTINQLLLAAFKVLLYKYSGNDDLVVGVPAAGRTRAELHNLLGIFINTLALRSYPTGEKIFGDFLEEVKQTSLDALKSQDYPFELLVDKLDIKRDRSRNPLFDIMFSFTHQDREGLPLGDVLLDPLRDIYDSSKFDLLLEGIKTGDVMELHLEYSTDLFEEPAVTAFLEHYVHLLSIAEASLGKRLADIHILGQEEESQLLEANDASYPADRCLHQLFEEQVWKHPAKPALVWQGQETSYQELDLMANRIAAAVCAALPDAQNPIIAVLLDRGTDMIATLLGILKAGGAYLPIDPDYPADRIRYMLDDSRAGILITHSGIVPVTGYDGKTIRVDQIGEDAVYNPVAVQPGDLAYIIYTSGSTGNPKGVMIEHRNVVRLLFNDRNLFDFTENDTWTLFHSYCFDFSVWEMYGALLYGGKLVIVPKETAQSPAEFLELLKKERVTVLNQTPGSFYNIIAAEKAQDFALMLRYVIFGGEALKPAKLEPWKEKYPYCRLINMYGITETTVHVTYKEITEREIGQGASNIGKPIPTLSLCILDRDLNLVPTGVAGELCISGAGLARGYLNRPQLTAERFTDHPYRPGAKLYRTGDLAKRLANGDIEYLGRIDHQVKIRGFRIELGEIESRLMAHPAVQDVLVTDLEDATGSRYLCAYLTGNSKIGVQDLREHLAAFLPDYMIPSFFVLLEQFPLTGNGKIDRKRLPAPEASGLSASVYEAPETLTEQKLAALWIQLLRIPQAGRKDHFFERGGHSLKAVQLTALIHKTFHTEISIKEVFSNPRLNDMAALIHNSAHTAHHAIERASSCTTYPASSAEKRLFILNRMDDSGISYNIPGMYAIEGDLDLKRWNLALQALIRRHEILRTSFMIEQGEVVQKIAEDVGFEIDIHNCEDEALNDYIHDFIRPFDLTEAPLLRVTLLRTGSGSYFFLFDIHHIISDGISMEVFMQELALIYSGTWLPELNIQAGDFALWQQKWLQSPEALTQQAFWKAQFEEELPLLNMPVDFTRPPVKSYEGALHRFTIPVPVVREIGTMGRSTGATPFMIMLAAFNILLAKYSGQEDIVIGTAVAGRSHADVQELIGMFVNTLPLRNFPVAGKRFADFVQEVKENCLQAFEHQDYPFEALLDTLDIKRDRSRNPLFDYMITYRPEHKRELQFADLLLREVPLPHHISKMDLSLDVCGAEDGTLAVTVEYATRLFSPDTIKRLTGHFNQILTQVTANPDIDIKDIEVVTAQERAEILYQFNNTDAGYAEEAHGFAEVTGSLSVNGNINPGSPRTQLSPIPATARNVYTVFEENAKQFPAHIAVETEEGSISYRELQKRVALLAAVLVTKGCGPEKIIGIYTDRSIAMITAILAILKAGGAYLPIDPEYPQERIRYMLEDSGAIFVLTQKRFASKLAFAANLVFVDEPADISLPAISGSINIRPDSLAYVIYTSGSTGKPKGVQIEHRSLYNFLFSNAANYPQGFSDGDVCLSLCNIAFDVSVLEIFMPLVFGGKLVLLNREKLFDVRALAGVIVDQKITFCYIPPSLLEPLYKVLKGSAPIALNKMDVGVEPIKDTVLEAYCSLNKKMQIMNGYGPTEATIACSWFAYAPGHVKGANVPIGKPIHNTRIYIVDEHLKLQPVGVPGELCIAGAGLARGYLNNPELTTEKFIDNPFEPGAKLYRTGDLCKWLPDGNIDFIGRKDHQVKIRGFRIELGEIESKLMNHPAIKQALVMDKADSKGNKFLCAYVVSPERPGHEVLRAHLATELPAYMVPDFFVVLEQFPLTKNEKVDRKALPEPELRQERNGSGPLEPANDTERKMLAIWQTVLGSERLGVTDNFFESGGNSLKIINMLGMIQQTFGDTLKVSDLFDKPSIREQAAVLAKNQSSVAGPSKKAKRVEF